MILNIYSDVLDRNERGHKIKRFGNVTRKTSHSNIRNSFTANVSKKVERFIHDLIDDHPHRELQYCEIFIWQCDGDNQFLITLCFPMMRLFVCVNHHNSG